MQVLTTKCLLPSSDMQKRLVKTISIALILLFLLCSCSVKETAEEPEGVIEDVPVIEEPVFEELALNTEYQNLANGYSFVFPEETAIDESLAKYVITAQGKYFSCTISCERSPYKDCHPEMTEGLKVFAPDFPYEDGIDQYIGYYQSRFILNAGWQSENNVSVTNPEILLINNYKAYLFHAVIEDAPKDTYDAYSYAYIRTGGQNFIRMVFRYDSRNTYFKNQVSDICRSLTMLESKGGAIVSAKHSPVLPTNWTEETSALYSRLVNNTEMAWGIYTADIFGSGIDEKIPSLEESLNYKFDVILAYIHSCMEFPGEFMEKNWNNGRIVELTYQITNNNNENFLVDSPMLDIYRGENLDTIRAFARAAKEFGHPFLLRVCNEMNSDWTSYGGVVNMGDPEIFIQVWRKLYEIFEEEGVNNCIWVFNPNDRPAPPCKWNNALCYYPGDEYVQVIGVTGYNNGTYYKRYGETWREFKTIYDLIENEYEPVFGDFPWMITEFASSSYGGNKVSWINSMFKNIGSYKNIKIAVWFSEADYTEKGVAARPYWLDETPATLNAFKKGLSGYKSGLLR